MMEKMPLLWPIWKLPLSQGPRSKNGAIYPFTYGKNKVTGEESLPSALQLQKPTLHQSPLGHSLTVELSCGPDAAPLLQEGPGVVGTPMPGYLYG